MVDQETLVSSGVKGAAPLGLPPPLGREGVTLATTTEICRIYLKTRISTVLKIRKARYQLPQKRITRIKEIIFSRVLQDNIQDKN
jgi:hypothetical protein